MFLSLETLRLLPKLHNHHHRRRRRMSEASMSASLQAFRSKVSENILRRSESLKLGSESFSLKWIHQCFQMLPIFNKAFSTLMVEIDYPMSKWEAYSIEEYFNYTINLLQLLNSINSALSHLAHVQISLVHALNLMKTSPNLAKERMKEIQTQKSINEFEEKGGDDVVMHCNGKERIFDEAMAILKSSGLWVCGIVLFGLNSEFKAYMGNGVFANSSLKEIIEKFESVKEVKEVNEAVAGLIVSGGIGDYDDGMELKRRLEVLGIALKGLKEEEEVMFSKVLATRNEVLEILRRNNQLSTLES